MDKKYIEQIREEYVDQYIRTETCLEDTLLFVIENLIAELDKIKEEN